MKQHLGCFIFLNWVSSVWYLLPCCFLKNEQMKHLRTNSTFVQRTDGCLQSHKSCINSSFWWSLRLLLIRYKPHILHFCRRVFIEKAVNCLFVRAFFSLTQSGAFMELMWLSVKRGNGFLCIVESIGHWFPLFSHRSCELLVCVCVRGPDQNMKRLT